jgi:tRNA dimethylallyltransferase
VSKKHPKILVIVGPTASGKSDLAVKLAREFNGEVVSADSRQVYTGLDIGTGKVTESEMAGITHHMLSVVSPTEIFSVSAYRDMAEKHITDIIARGKLPIICGGTGFYIQALVDGINLPHVPPDEALRATLKPLSTNALYEKLLLLDPDFASIVDRHNPHRLIRAIEIATSLGSVPPLEKNEHYDPLFIGISVDLYTLRERIHLRLLTRLDEGMITEAKTLYESGLSFPRMEALGLEYRYLARYLQGTITKEEMEIQLENEIFHYAKRQLTWFKRDPRIRWFSRDDLSEINAAVETHLNNERRTL